MKYWERFNSYKERGEWVELLFMAAAKRAFCAAQGAVMPVRMIFGRTRRRWLPARAV